MDSKNLKTFGSVPAKHLRVEPIMHIGPLISQLGGSPKKVFANASIDKALFDHAENCISLEQLELLIKEAVLATGCQHFGIAIGSQATSAPLGLLNAMLMQCANVGTALAYFQQYFHLHDRIGIMTRSVEDQSATIGYMLMEGNSSEGEHNNDGAVTLGICFLRQLMGPHWKPTSIKLPRRPPADVTPYLAVFGRIPQFNAEHAEIRFPAADLSRSIPNSLPGRFQLLSEKINTLASLNDLSFSEVVSRIVRGLLVLRRCSLDEVAAALSMHRRTINRMLRQENTSYQQIAQEASRTLSERLLISTDMSIPDISATLNYSDSSAFTRAFKSWHGCPPQAWRKSQIKLLASLA